MIAGERGCGGEVWHRGRSEAKCPLLPLLLLQAEGRAHRLGQESTVMVYQMYTAASVEERILELAAK